MSPSSYNDLKFTECCSQTEIFFSIRTADLPGYLLPDYTYIYTDLNPFEGSGGYLENNTCYTLTLTGGATSPIPNYPLVPANNVFDKDPITCGDPLCPSCIITYQLTDCSNPNNIKYTCSDLADYVNYVIKLRNCDTICWKVSTSQNPADPQPIDEIIGFFLPIDLGTRCEYDFSQIDSQVLDQVDYATIIINGTTYTFDPFVNGPTLANEIDQLNLGECTYDIDSNVLVITGNETYGPLTLIISGEVPITLVVPKVCVLLFEYNCAACLPEPPTPVIPKAKPRDIRPGYFSKNPCVSVDYIEKVNCTFGKQVYDQMVSVRYGIQSCCIDDVNKWDIKKEILDFELAKVPEEELLISRPCYCYEIEMTLGTACFKYINCNGNWTNVTLVALQTVNVCSKNKPQLLCPTGNIEYTITSSIITCTSNTDCE